MLRATVARFVGRGILSVVTRHALLHAAMDQAYARARARPEGLTDNEFFWQPVPDCWTIYQDRGGRWTSHQALPEPQPAPVTTIGWQLVHPATCKLMYHEWAFGPARLTWPELDSPHTASGRPRAAGAWPGAPAGRARGGFGGAAQGAGSQGAVGRTCS